MEFHAPILMYSTRIPGDGRTVLSSGTDDRISCIKGRSEKETDPKAGSEEYTPGRYLQQTGAGFLSLASTWFFVTGTGLAGV